MRRSKPKARPQPKKAPRQAATKSRDASPSLEGGNDFAVRLRTAFAGKDANEIARVVGVSKASFYKWLAGKFEPDLAKLVALGNIANVTLDWLVAGRGEIRPDDLPGYIKPQSPVQPEPLAFERQWLRLRVGAQERADVILAEVQDDSMEPALRRGDLLLALETGGEHANGIYICARKQAESGEKILLNRPSGEQPLTVREPEEGEDTSAMFLVNSKGYLVNRLFARRIEWLADSSAIVKCDNPAYPLEVKISPENDQGILIVGRGVWHGRLI